MNKTKHTIVLGAGMMIFAMLVSACAPQTAADAKDEVLDAEIPLTGADAQDKVLAKANYFLPAEVGESIQGLDDVDSNLFAAKKSVGNGDNFLDGLYERPFTAGEMVYQPDVDIIYVSLSMDEEFYYFTISLFGFDPSSNALNGAYGIEFDVDKDGRGDYLIWVESVASLNWTLENVFIYADEDKDLGASRPFSAEPEETSSGYEKILFSEDRNDTPDAYAYVRLQPNGEPAVQFAIPKSVLADAQEFLWSAYADAGVRNPALFEYNDSFMLVDAGSPNAQDKYYPLKALHSFDSTCRKPFGFNASGGIAGICRSAPPPAPESPAPTPRPTPIIIY